MQAIKGKGLNMCEECVCMCMRVGGVHWSTKSRTMQQYVPQIMTALYHMSHMMVRTWTHN